MPPISRRQFLNSAAVAAASLSIGSCGGKGPGEEGGSGTKTPTAAPAAAPGRFADVRGFNYTPSTALNDITFWRDYDEALVERELEYARRIGLNSARVFLHYVVFEHDGPQFLSRLRHFVRAGQARGISTLPVVWDSCFSEVNPAYDTDLNDWIPNPGVQRLGRNFWPDGERYCRELIQTLGPEPGLLGWDIMNEPLMTSWIWTDPSDKAQRVETIWAFVRHFSEIFAAEDPRHPRTVGNAYASWLKETADVLDLLSFHDYSPHRPQMRRHLEEGQAFARQVGKPVIVTEIGCPARSNPYDMAVETCLEYGLGWHVWELMIGKSRWNDIHGLVYPDGTVRDPGVVAAVQGFFRRRRGPRIAYSLDKEGIVGGTLGEAEKWLDDPRAPYARGRSLLEQMANLLESGELIPMAEPPSVRVLELQEESSANAAEIKRLLREWGAVLKPRVQNRGK